MSKPKDIPVDIQGYSRVETQGNSLNALFLIKILLVILMLKILCLTKTYNAQTVNNSIASNGTANVSNTDDSNKICHIFFEIPWNYKEVLENLTKNVPYVEAKTTGEHLKITTYALETFRMVQSFVTERGFPFRIMDPKAERPKKKYLYKDFLLLYSRGTS